MQARYNEIPEPVRFCPAGGGYTAVFIAINPEAATETTPDGGVCAFYWVDYHEFILPTSELDKDAILANPAAYLNYPGDDPQFCNAVINAVQMHMDAVAQAHGYDNIHTASTYAGDTHPIYGEEGRIAKAWRSACWDYCLRLLADVRAGAAAKPDSVQAVLDRLPAADWPHLKQL